MLLLLLMLLLLSLFCLLGCGMRLCHLFRGGLLSPAPFLFELFVHEAYTPASLLVDLLENPEDFLLLAAIGEYFACVCERSDGYRSDAAVIMSVNLLKLTILRSHSYRSLT